MSKLVFGDVMKLNKLAAVVCLFLLQRSTLDVQTNVSIQAEAPSLRRGFNAAQNNRVGLNKVKQAGAVLQLQQAECL